MGCETLGFVRKKIFYRLGIWAVKLGLHKIFIYQSLCVNFGFFSFQNLSRQKRMNLVRSWRVRKQFYEFGWVMGFWGEEILESGKRGGWWC